MGLLVVLAKSYMQTDVTAHIQSDADTVNICYSSINRNSRICYTLKLYIFKSPIKARISLYLKAPAAGCDL